MHIEILNKSIDEIESDMAIVYIFEESTTLTGATKTINNIIKNRISALINDGEVRGKYAEMTVIHNFGDFPPRKVMIVGLGKQVDLNLDKIRQIAALAVQHCRKCCTKNVVTTLSSLDDTLATDVVTAALVEGALLGLYNFEIYKSKKDPQTVLEQLWIAEPDEQKAKTMAHGIKKGRVFAEATNFARDLVNHPGNFMTPAILADRATYVAEHFNLELSILEKADMERAGMGAMLGVSQGSEEPPKLILLKYSGNQSSDEVVTFIGKGVTFDSGGISIKPSEGMGVMKEDMAGGATVIGAMMAIGMLRPKINVVGIIPAVENMPSGKALKPGDIITTLSGKTIEIITTDAEGRLILADAVTFARQTGATKIIDIATLTGACVVALGTIVSGVVSNDRQLADQVLSAAKQAGEKMWELPNYDEYKEQIKGVLADLKNSGGRHAGAITAGLFISEFAEDTPWVHIDIAGTASVDKVQGYNVKGATGVGVRTLVQLILNMEG